VSEHTKPNGYVALCLALAVVLVAACFGMISPKNPARHLFSVKSNQNFGAGVYSITNISAGTVIMSDMLAERPLPYPIPAGAPRRMAQVIGRRARISGVGISAGTVIRNRDLEPAAARY
jgi:hypothetical protein